MGIIVSGITVRFYYSVLEQSVLGALSSIQDEYTEHLEKSDLVH